MATHPSQKWEDGKLVERAQDVRGDAEENEATAVTGSPIKPHQSNSTFTSRREARLGRGKKAVDSDDVEDKAVGKSERKSKGRR